MKNENTKERTGLKMKYSRAVTNQTILDTIKELKTLGVTKAGFSALGEINYIEMVNEKPEPQIDPVQFKKAVQELDEQTLYYSAD